MNPPAEDTVQPIVAAHAEGCLTALLQSAPRAEAALRTGRGWTVCLLAFPTPAGATEPPGLTACDRDCLALLAQAQEPLSGTRARKELEKRSIGIYGLVTVKRSLAKLKRLGLVSNSKRSPRGYFLPENLPLFRDLFHV
jgi:hypothetical protein